MLEEAPPLLNDNDDEDCTRAFLNARASCTVAGSVSEAIVEL